MTQVDIGRSLVRESRSVAARDLCGTGLGMGAWKGKGGGGEGYGEDGKRRVNYRGWLYILQDRRNGSAGSR